MYQYIPQHIQDKLYTACTYSNHPPPHTPTGITHHHIPHPQVAQLAGYVAEHSAYHHGEASLASTIVGLAQDFVGSNNVNVLVPSGQFGTRLQGGKDAASPRYIFTRMSTITRHLFNAADDQLLSYLNEEGQTIEPEWWVLGRECGGDGGEGVGEGCGFV